MSASSWRPSPTPIRHGSSANCWVSRDRHAQFHGWANDLGLGFSYAVAEHLARIEAALQGLYACVDDLLAARRAAPGPDLISALLAAQEAGDHLHDEELRALVAFLVFASQDTTRNQLGCALTAFLEHPAQWARLAEEPALAPRAVEEVMRIRPAVPAVWRVAAEDFEFRGLRIAAGTFLSLFAAAANTDPRVFGAAEFDIGLERPAQLTFGGGIHYCLGAPWPVRRWQRRCRSWRRAARSHASGGGGAGGRRWASVAPSHSRSASAPRPESRADPLMYPTRLSTRGAETGTQLERKQGRS